MSQCLPVCLCESGPRLFSLSFCFTILSSGLCPYNCKMTFETPVITFKSKTGERAVFLLILLYQESKSVLRNSHNRLLLGVISQNLVTWLPMAPGEVGKVATGWSLLPSASGEPSQGGTCCCSNKIRPRWARQKEVSDYWMGSDWDNPSANQWWLGGWLNGNAGPPCNTVAIQVSKIELSISWWRRIFLLHCWF